MNRYPLTDSFMHDHACAECHDTGRYDCLGCGGLGCDACDYDGRPICDCAAGDVRREAIEYARDRRCEICGERAMACGSVPRCDEHDEESGR